jgi:hypothetical protein
MTVQLLTGPFLAACALLAIAGATKLRRPATARDAARALHLPASDGAVRVLGAAEIVAAVTGAVFGGAGALAVAVMYALLTAAAFTLWRRAPGTPCGCLGASPTPATGSHVVVDAAAMVIAALVATGPAPPSVLADQPLLGIPLLVLTACATWAGALLMDAWPALRTAEQERSS